MIEEFDKDGDGEINEEEFYEIMRYSEIWWSSRRASAAPNLRPRNEGITYLATDMTHAVFSRAAAGRLAALADSFFNGQNIWLWAIYSCMHTLFEWCPWLGGEKRGGTGYNRDLLLPSASICAGETECLADRFCRSRRHLQQNATKMFYGYNQVELNWSVVSLLHAVQQLELSVFLSGFSIHNTIGLGWASSFPFLHLCTQLCREFYRGTTAQSHSHMVFFLERNSWVTKDLEILVTLHSTSPSDAKRAENRNDFSKASFWGFAEAELLFMLNVLLSLPMLRGNPRYSSGSLLKKKKMRTMMRVAASKQSSERSISRSSK